MAVKIFVDQGHNPAGNPNAGAEGQGLNEGEINYAVGTYLANLLNADYRFDARVSRASPTDVVGTSNATSLQQRVAMANNWPADYFISIHTNASPNPEANGSEVYVYNLNSVAGKLGKSVLDSIVQRVGTKNNGVRENKTLYVLRRTKMPAILVELGYITNTKDAEFLRNGQYAYADAIYRGILNYFGYPALTT